MAVVGGWELGGISYECDCGVYRGLKGRAMRRVVMFLCGGCLSWIILVLFREFVVVGGGIPVCGNVAMSRDRIFGRGFRVWCDR